MTIEVLNHPSAASAAGATSAPSTAVRDVLTVAATAGTTSATLIAADPTGITLRITNTHATQTLYVNAGTAATTSSWDIAPGTFLDIPFPFNTAINCIGSAAGTTYTYRRSKLPSGETWGESVSVLSFASGAIADTGSTAILGAVATGRYAIFRADGNCVVHFSGNAVIAAPSSTPLAANTVLTTSRVSTSMAARGQVAGVNYKCLRTAG